MNERRDPTHALSAALSAYIVHLFKHDLIAGITVSLVAIPQSLAYAQLADVFQIAFGALRMSVMSVLINFLSHPVLMGFTMPPR
jgi:MFS superfamily sulfate permease-like transporter